MKLARTISTINAFLACLILAASLLAKTMPAQATWRNTLPASLG